MTPKNNPLKESTEDREFVISRVFDAPRELVFKAWTVSLNTYQQERAYETA